MHASRASFCRMAPSVFHDAEPETSNMSVVFNCQSGTDIDRQFEMKSYQCLADFRGRVELS